MLLNMHINTKNKSDNYLLDLFKKNYKDNKEYPPEYQYKCILESDYWFTLYDTKTDNIIASCSICIENDNIYEINDVLVEEKYRGNNYSILLIMNVLHYLELNKNNLLIKIHSEINSDAYYCYKKIFGKEYRKDERYAYFSYKL